jgi:glyoxylase-like metal-dependent hydrolase (beta-lactamase superfamily II)
MIDSLSLVERENLGWDKRIRSFNASDLVDLYTVTTENFLIIFDTGNAPEQMQGIMTLVENELKGRQLLVINSHQHFDHAWGNALFIKDGKYPAPIIGQQVSITATKDETFLATMKAEKPFLSNVKIIPPTLTFSEHFTIYGGDLTLELFSTPGHSSDHISVWIPELETILAADTAEHPVPYAAPDGSIKQLEQDLELLKSFKPKIVLPCHGGTTEPTLIDRNLHYFKTLREKIAAKPFDNHLKAEDVPTALGWTFNGAMQDLGLVADTFTDFYQGLHVQNIQSILKDIDIQHKIWIEKTVQER